jgi:predicted Zn-dependent protease with MMP-like domain
MFDWFKRRRDWRRRLELGAEAFALLPEHVQDVLRRVPILLKHLPDEADRAIGIPADVAGVFVEDVSAEADRDDEDDTTTPVKRGRVVIFIGNIRPPTAEGVAGVMLHETAHVAGLDDEQAHCLGL